jgi:general nucleoside transport system ATP-binding protein
MAPVIEARGITKLFPGVVANDNVSLILERGEILALLGENGAGKSTLMNILYGLYRPEEGQILIDGVPVAFHDPRDAIKHGIGMVHQHFMLIPVMSVTENMMLGEEHTTTSAYVTAGVAALVGALFGYLLGGPGLVQRILVALVWVGVAGLFLVLQRSTARMPVNRTVLGVVAGFLIGLAVDIVLRLVGEVPIAFPIWPPIGAVVGLLAGMRWLDKLFVATRIRDLSADFGLEVDPTAVVGDLPVGAQQRVEIIKALYRDAKVLILDEPTAVLTPQEADDLFKIMRRLAERGVSIIFITHKLREVLAIADQISVLRRGQLVGSTTPGEATRESLAQMMVGREVLLQVRKEDAKPGESVLLVQNLVVHDDRGHAVVNGVSFNVRSGEIVGIAGVQGNGQTELAEAITRLREARGGEITILGTDVTRSNPREVTAHGTGHIPEDRHRHGLVLNYPVADNLILTDYYHPPFSKGIVLDEPNIVQNAERLIAQYDVRTPSLFTLASKLSGGNQQKVIIARELSREPRLLIANQPTRGLDVGSIEFIHNQIVAARDSGAGVLLVSAELDEIMSLSDRILVMYHGRIMSWMTAAEATREELGLLMAGIETDRQRTPQPAS